MTTIGQFEPWQFEDIRRVADESGVPFDVLVATIAVESGGDWEQDGSRVVQGSILPYVGLFDRDLSGSGESVESLRGNHEGQVRALAWRLAVLRDDLDVWDLVAQRRYRGPSLLQIVGTTFRSIRAKAREMGT